MCKERNNASGVKTPGFPKKGGQAMHVPRINEMCRIEDGVKSDEVFSP